MCLRSPEFSIDGLDATEGSLENSPRGKGVTDRLLHRDLKQSDIEFPRPKPTTAQS